MSNKIRERSVNLENSLKKKLYSRIPGYIYSNDLFETWIKESLNNRSTWLDAGCGKNSLVYEFQEFAPSGIGIDLVEHPGLIKDDGRFIRGSLEDLPFDSESFDTIVANMVIEHVIDIKRVLENFRRVLKPGGSFIFRTTNKLYPVLFAGNLLPKKVKDKIIYWIFGVNSHDIFVTHYKMNTYNKIKSVLPENGFRVKKLEAVEDIHLFSPMVFRISSSLYNIQKLNAFRCLRNCLVCWAVKE